MRTQLAAAAIVVAAGTMPALAGGTLVRQFSLFDHPDGGVNPQAYGLRLDGFNDATPVTFSFEDRNSGESNVRLQVFDDGVNLEIRIHGTVWGNSASGGDDYGDFLLDVTYTVNTQGTGWQSAHANAGNLIGTLDHMPTGMQTDLGEVDLFERSDGSGTFRFLEDGFRLAGDSSTWVGRGWVNGDDGNTNDFLFTAVVPLPPAAFAGLGMLAGMGAYRRLRRR